MVGPTKSPNYFNQYFTEDSIEQLIYTRKQVVALTLSPTFSIIPNYIVYIFVLSIELSKKQKKSEVFSSLMSFRQKQTIDYNFKTETRDVQYR